MAEAVRAFARHALVTIDPAAWPAIVGDQAEPLLTRWAADGRPAIVRRAGCAYAEGSVPIGVPLPPSLGKRRVALVAPVGAIIARAPPPLLSAAAEAAPAGWQPMIATLLLALPDVRCFGSLAWQHLTGLPYLSDTSDLDLLVACEDPAAADRAAALLNAINASAMLRLDGELVAPNESAVQWREWASGTAELLVKRPGDALLLPRDAVFG